MADPSKKLTFGFSKVVKKTNLVVPPTVKNDKPSNVQYIDCLEAKSIKLKNGEEEEKEKAPLVIPIIGPRKSSTIANGKSIAEIVEDFSEENKEDAAKKEELTDAGPPDSLDALAAREILQESKDGMKEPEPSTLEALPVADDADAEKLQKESTLEDYENIPVNQFGLAMLRGMGWKPDEGIGKNKQLVAVTAPAVRPKGMGLGADKMIREASASKTLSSSKEEELKMVKGAFVKVFAGMHRNQYAQVEGFSDDSGRAILKMAIGGHVISVNETSLQLVSKSEYNEYSKVLNATKYDAYKTKEEKDESFPGGRKKSPTYDTEIRQSSPSYLKVHKKANLHSDSKESRSAKSRRSQTPDSEKRKGRPSISPVIDRKKSSSRRHRYQSPSPHRSHHRRVSPSNPADRLNSDKNRRLHSPSVSRRRSSSQSRDRYSQSLNQSSDSDCDAKFHKRKKKKHKERKRNQSSSSSDERSRSRSLTPKKKKKKKEKKSKRSCSRSPTHQKYR